MFGGYLQFANPAALHLLWLAPLLALFLWSFFRQKRHVLEQLGDVELIRKMAATVSPGRQVAKAVMIVAAVICGIIALARPQIGTRLETVRRQGIDIIIAVDLSRSMLAEDIAPNRLERAKQEVSSFIDHLQGDRIGIVAFAGTAFVQCPLTLDYGAAKMFLDYLDTNLIPVPGTSIGKAIEVATGAFNQRERKYKAIVLITDGEDHGSDPVAAAKAAHEQGIRIYTIGIGSREGQPIPVRAADGSMQYERDEKGELILSRLDPVTLQKIALATNGKYHNATTGELELQSIYDDIRRLGHKQLMTRKFTQHEDRFQYPLAFAIMLLAVEWAISDRKNRTQKSAVRR